MKGNKILVAVFVVAGIIGAVALGFFIYDKFMSAVLDKVETTIKGESKEFMKKAIPSFLSPFKGLQQRFGQALTHSVYKQKYLALGEESLGGENGAAPAAPALELSMGSEDLADMYEQQKKLYSQVDKNQIDSFENRIATIDSEIKNFGAELRQVQAEVVTGIKKISEAFVGKEEFGHMSLKLEDELKGLKALQVAVQDKLAALDTIKAGADGKSHVEKDFAAMKESFETLETSIAALRGEFKQKLARINLSSVERKEALKKVFEEKLGVLVSSIDEKISTTEARFNAKLDEKVRSLEEQLKAITEQLATKKSHSAELERKGARKEVLAPDSEITKEDLSRLIKRAVRNQMEGARPARPPYRRSYVVRDYDDEDY
jgi:hypothetical protein